MKNNVFRPLLRWWIVLTTLAAFLTGWVALAHFQTGTAAAGSSSAASEFSRLPTLAPLPSLENSPAMRPLRIQPSIQSSVRLRTGAS